MSLSCGIVGLPNVGKSTLFNALTATAAAQAANYPFCTIEPNVGRVNVPDLRLDTLAGIAQSANVIPTTLEFVDIAGLVRGAATGEGLGNKFLAHIREVDAILHVLRCFEDGDVTHIDGGVDPLRDAATVETELMLADLESLERRTATLGKKAKGGDKATHDLLAIMEPALVALREGKPARVVRQSLAPDQTILFDQLQLITARPVLYIANVGEADAARGNVLSQKVVNMAAEQGAGCVTLAAAIEAEVAVLPDAAERQAFLEALDLKEPSLNAVIRAGYALLNLLTFFTVGPKEARAWTVQAGALAPEAAGVIHTDFQRGFIRAETIAYDDFVACRGESGARDAGKLRQEGKEYRVQDGDVMHFKFNV